MEKANADDTTSARYGRSWISFRVFLGSASPLNPESFASAEDRLFPILAETASRQSAGHPISYKQHLI